LFSEEVVSRDKGIKSLWRAIWTRLSGREPGSESSEKVADSTVKTLIGGMRTLGGVPSARKGAMGVVGSSPAWTLLMRRDRPRDEEENEGEHWGEMDALGW